MELALARYELRGLGRVGLAMPAGVLLGFAGLAGLMRLLGAADQQIARVLVAALEVGLPLAAGMVAAGIATGDPAIALQLALRTRYRVTLARRLVLLVVWTALWGFAWTTSLHLVGLWGHWVPESFLVGQLVWLAPLVWLASAGAALALLFGSRAAAGAILGGLWAGEHVFRGLFLTTEWLRWAFLFATTYAPGTDFWLPNRVALIATALALGVSAWLLSSNTERLARGGEP
jgi:hypothetical protein